MEKNIVEFESPLHRRLYYLSAALIPFEVSTAWIKDEELLESCRQFYNYVNDAYDDILEYPIENYIDPFDPALDNTDNGNLIADSLEFHRSILDTFIKAAYIIENDSVMCKKTEYDKLIKNRKNIFLTNVRGSKFKIPFKFDDLMINLSRRGIVIKYFADDIVITNEKYPQMFLALKKMYEAVGLNTDFRFIENPSRKRELEDIFYPLMPHEEKMARELIACAVQKNLKGGFIRKSRRGMYPSDYSFSCKKYENHVIAFIWRTSYGLKIKITLPEPEDAPSEHALLLQKINELDNAEDIKNFCSDTLRPGCPPQCKGDCGRADTYKKTLFFLGRPIPKSTGCWGFGLFFPLNEESFAMTKILINILTEIY